MAGAVAAPLRMEQFAPASVGRSQLVRLGSGTSFAGEGEPNGELAPFWARYFRPGSRRTSGATTSGGGSLRRS